MIDGKLYVSPGTELPEDEVATWLFERLLAYRLRHRTRIKYLSRRARVFVADRPAVTCPGPDVAVYRNFPTESRIADLRWQGISPIIVAEVLYDSDPHKDLVRNVDLYLQVPSIREYWLLDARYSADEPTLIVHRRRGKRWVRREFHFGETYKTKLLPGFSLVVDPRK